jgi:hypothetical protein
MTWQEGDLVEAVKDGFKITAAVVRTDYGELALPSSPNLSRVLCKYLSGWIDEGWTLTLIERAAPKVELPTAAGLYIGSDALNSNDAFLVRVTKLGGPIQYPNSSISGGWRKLGDPERFAPFTKLEPVADTARKVLARLVEIRSIEIAGEPTLFASQIQTLANEFGMSE